MDIADSLKILLFLFAGVPSDCQDALDVSDSGAIDVTDANFTLTLLFRRGPPPPELFLGCGTDRTEDSMRCDRFGTCP